MHYKPQRVHQTYRKKLLSTTWGRSAPSEKCALSRTAENSLHTHQSDTQTQSLYRYTEAGETNYPHIGSLRKQTIEKNIILLVLLYIMLINIIMIIIFFFLLLQHFYIYTHTISAGASRRGFRPDLSFLREAKQLRKLRGAAKSLQLQ